jgi:hypothetical protein
LTRDTKRARVGRREPNRRVNEKQTGALGAEAEKSAL